MLVDRMWYRREVTVNKRNQNFQPIIYIHIPAAVVNRFPWSHWGSSSDNQKRARNQGANHKTLTAARSANRRSLGSSWPAVVWAEDPTLKLGSLNDHYHQLVFWKRKRKTSHVNVQITETAPRTVTQKDTRHSPLLPDCGDHLTVRCNVTMQCNQWLLTWGREGLYPMYVSVTCQFYVYISRP